MILSPSLLSADFGALGAVLGALEQAGLRWAHWDVMDGVFVPNITLGAPVIRCLRRQSGLFFDVHLMIVEPERHLQAFAEAGADMLVVHAEACVHLERTLASIHSLGVKCGVALNPHTPLCCLEYILDDVDMVLVMSVNPGFGGQHFLPASLRKIRELKKMIRAAGADVLIEVDGGITLENTPLVVGAGADVLVSGSAFFGCPPYGERHAAFLAAAVEKEEHHKS